MKIDIKVREAGFKDIDDIAHLETECFSDPWSKESIRDEIEKNPMSLYMVAEDTNERKTVGYAGLWQIFDEGHITNVAVSKKYRKCGIGTKVVESLLETARSRGVRAFTLEVRVSNDEAQRLYEKYGFVNAGIRPGYYMDGEDAMIMWLNEKPWD